MSEPDSLVHDSERRRWARFSCGGLAKIICLPSDGVFLPGRICDLSLGGCGVQIARPLSHGTLAEIAIRVRGSSFRALGCVRAIRGPVGIGMQFLQLTSGGQDMLVELLRELARQQAIANIVRKARQGPDAGSFPEQRLTALSQSLRLLGEPGAPEELRSNAPGSRAVSATASVADGDIDLFI